MGVDDVLLMVVQLLVEVCVRLFQVKQLWARFSALLVAQVLIDWHYLHAVWLLLDEQTLELRARGLEQYADGYPQEKKKNSQCIAALPKGKSGHGRPH